MRRFPFLAGALLTLAVIPAARAWHGSLRVGSLQRNYTVHRPAGLSRSRPVPLVIMLHGGFGTGRGAEHRYRWDAQADRDGFVVAYPDGVRRSWNAGGVCCGKAHRDHVDDIGFLTRLIETLRQRENIDPRRVYLTGISNGAAMAYRYGCQGPYPIAAIGSVAGSFAVACPRPHPVSVMEIHGLDDQNIPMAGGHGPKAYSPTQWLPVEQTLDAFRRADRCGPPSSHQRGPVHTDVSRCAGGRDVTLITIAGAGHQWPGGRPIRPFVARIFRLDEPSRALDATPVLWDFFQSHPAH
jgi:polyhydroxybutyrate depolymerase